VDRLTDTQVRTAAAKVGDFPLNIGVGRVGILREQGIWALLYQVSFHIRGRRSHPNFRIADDPGVIEWWLAKS
jgi:hypothetical protein